MCSPLEEDGCAAEDAGIGAEGGKAQHHVLFCTGQARSTNSPEQPVEERRCNICRTAAKDEEVRIDAAQDRSNPKRQILKNVV